MQNDIAENVNGMQVQMPMSKELVELKHRSLLKKEDAYKTFKRTSDVIISSLALVALSPIMAITAICIKLNSKGSVLYKQKRIGKNGQYFMIYKFRTMVSDANNFNKYFTKEQMEEYKKNYKLDNDPRITKIGKFLRKTSLDELPQLINILKGELSIVGPRPVVDGEIEKYGESKEKFLSVTPGLTGNWAANGRSSTSYKERMELELDYVDNMSFKMDVKILWKTVISVLQKKGAV